MARNPAKHLSTRVLVEIDRDMTAKTSKVIWKHEIPILEAILGEGKVKEVPPETLNEGFTAKVSPTLLPYNKSQDALTRPADAVGVGFVFIGDARTEYERCAACYGKLPDENILAVEKVYGRFQDERFERLVGRAQLDDLPDAQLRQLVEAFGLAPTPNWDAKGDGAAEAAAARNAFMQASREELLTMAAEGGVQLG